MRSDTERGTKLRPATAPAHDEEFTADGAEPRSPEVKSPSVLTREKRGAMVPYGRIARVASLKLFFLIAAVTLGGLGAALALFVTTVPVSYVAAICNRNWETPPEVKVFAMVVFGALGFLGGWPIIRMVDPRERATLTATRPHAVRGFLLTSGPAFYTVVVWALMVMLGFSSAQFLLAIALGLLHACRAFRILLDFEQRRNGILWEAKLVVWQVFQAFFCVLIGGASESLLRYHYGTISGLPTTVETIQITARHVFAAAGCAFTLLAHGVLMHELQRMSWDRFSRLASRAMTVVAVPWASMAGTFAVCAAYNRPDYTAWPLATVAGILGWAGISKAFYGPAQLVNGRDKVSLDYAKEAATASRPDGDKGHFFLYAQLPRFADILHFAFVGTPRSGKGVAITLFCQDAFRDIGKGKDVRAIIWDAKQTAMEMLRGIGYKGKVHTFNASDIRSVALSLKNMTRALALDIASTLFYDRAESNPFFTTQARNFGAAVLVSMMLTADATRAELKEANPDMTDDELDRETEITFQDWVRIMSDVELVRQCLGRWDETRVVLTSVANPEVFSNIIATISAYLGELKIVAGFWDHTPPENRISIDEWAKDKEGSVLILQRSTVASKAVEALNQIIFKLVENAILGLPDSKTRRTYMILDELSSPPRWDQDALTRLALQAPSKGCCLILALQSIGSLRGLYGRDTADGLLGLTSHKVFFRLEDYDTQLWASQCVGKKRYWRGNISEGPNGTTVSWEKTDEFVIEPSDWATFGLSDFEVGIKAFAVSPITGAFYAHITGDFLKERIPLEDAQTPNFLPRPASHQELRPWTPEQRAKLGFAPVPPKLTTVDGGNTQPKPKQQRAKAGRKDESENLRLLRDGESAKQMPDWVNDLNRNAGRV